MSKSCFLPYATLTEFISVMDNILVVKMLHDEGIHFPDCRYDDRSLFLDALSLLFGSTICMEEESDYGKNIFSFQIGLIEEWQNLRRRSKDATDWEQRMDELLEELSEPLDDYLGDFELTAELVPYGLRIQCEGSREIDHEWVERFITFKHSLEQEINEWKNSEGAIVDGDVNFDSRGYQPSGYQAAS